MEGTQWSLRRLHDGEIDEGNWFGEGVDARGDLELPFACCREGQFGAVTSGRPVEAETGLERAEFLSREPGGDGDLVGLRISAEAWDPEDTDVLAELIIAAFRGAREQAEAAMRAGMPSMPQLPEGFGF